jgi:DnaK suppressor protein
MKNASRNAANHTEEFRRGLIEKRSELLTLLGLPVPEQGPAEPEDEMEKVVTSHEEYVAVSLSNLAREELQWIEEALERIETGGYGVCLECGESIAQKRLQSVPWARFCLSCEQRRES